MLKNLVSLVEAEPATSLGVVAAAANLAVGFGLHLTQHQTSLINGLAVVVVSLIVRAKVTPVPPSA